MFRNEGGSESYSGLGERNGSLWRGAEVLEVFRISAPSTGVRDSNDPFTLSVIVWVPGEPEMQEEV